MPAETQMKNLTIVAGCAVAALIATVLPYTTMILVGSVTALQVHPFLVVPPCVVLVAIWMLRQTPPISFTPNRIYSMRISFGVSIGLWVLDASSISGSNDLARPELGFFAYIAAVGAGLYFSFKCATVDRFATWPATPVPAWPRTQIPNAPSAYNQSWPAAAMSSAQFAPPPGRPAAAASSSPQIGWEPDSTIRRPSTTPVASPQESLTTTCPSCGKVNSAIRSTCLWCDAPIAGPPAAVAAPVAVAATPAVQAPAPPDASFTWSPTHLVPEGGMPFWDAPDTSRPAAGQLPEKVELTLEGRAGVWAQVRAANGWRGWVDGRLLVNRP
jgi:hypothetical protein